MINLKKINKIFYRNVFDHDKFEYYWEYLENNLEKLETILQKNDFKKNIFFPNKNIELYKNLKDLDLPYPTIFFYKDLKNKNYYLCHEWLDIDKDIKLFVDNKTLSKEKNQGCDLIDEERLVNLIKQRVVYKTNLNKNLEIIPILVGNINQKYEIKNENILKVKYLTKIDKDKNLEINLDNSSIIILELDQDSILETLKVNSSTENNSAFILKLNNKSLNKVEFNEIIPSGENINNLIGEKNITGCLNIINSNFKIKKLLINGSIVRME